MHEFKWAFLSFFFFRLEIKSDTKFLLVFSFTYVFSLSFLPFPVYRSFHFHPLGGKKKDSPTSLRVYPLSPNSNHYLDSPYTVSVSSNTEVMRIQELITKVEMSFGN